MKFKNCASFLLLILGLPISAQSLAIDASEDERRAQQASLDHACEVAREQKLGLERQRYIEECKNDTQRVDVDCDAFYSTYGDRAGNRAPLYYDLSECVEALEYQKSNRSSD